MLSVNPVLDISLGGSVAPSHSSSMSPFVWKYCRMCALELKQGVYIFGEEGKRLQLPEKIRKTLAILVLEEDILPKKICTSCCTNLESYVQYKDSVVDAQEKLAAIAKSIEKCQEQNLQLQLRTQQYLRSPKRPQLLGPSSASVISHSSTALVQAQQAPSLVAGEIIEMDDPVIDCDDPPSNPVSSVDSLEEEEEEESIPVPSKAVEERHNSQTNNHSYNRSPIVITECAINPSGTGSNTRDGKGAHPESSTNAKQAVSMEASSSPPEKVLGSSSSCLSSPVKNEAHLVCGHCVQPMLDKASLEDHHSKSHKDQEGDVPLHGCSACPRISSNHEAIRQHIYRHRMAGTFKCADCEKSFPTKDQLHVHISSKHNPAGSKAFACGICGNSYGSTAALLSHQRKSHFSEPEPEPSSTNSSKSPQKNTSPSEAGKSANAVSSNSNSSTSSTFGVAEKAKAPSSPGEKSNAATEEGFWKCGTCDKIFQSKFGYETHIAVHKGRRFTCEECGASYTQKPTLEHHIKVHHTNVANEFECPECKKKFKTFRQLGWHKKTHEKPLTDLRCPQCEKKFLNMISLKTHLKLHKGNKKYPCSECPKSFYSKQKLEEHINSHTGKRPLGCPGEKCVKVFSCFSNYAKHFKKHHQDMLGPKGKMIPPPKMAENNNNLNHHHNHTHKKFAKGHSPSKDRDMERYSVTPTPSPTLSEISVVHQPAIIIPTLSHSSTSTSTNSNFISSNASNESHSQNQNQNLVHSGSGPGPGQVQAMHTNSNNTSANLQTITRVAPVLPGNLGMVQTTHGGNIALAFSTTNSQTQTQTPPVLTHGQNNSTFNNNSQAPAFHPTSTATAATATQTLDVHNVNVAHHNPVTSLPSNSNHHPIALQVQTSPNSAHTASTQTQTQTHQFQVAHPQPQTQSVWQPMMLPSSKTYHHANPPGGGNGLGLLSSFEILECPSIVPAAHPSESHHPHPHQNTLSSANCGSTNNATIVPVSVVVAHHSSNVAHAVMAAPSASHHPHTHSHTGASSSSSSSSASHAIPISSNLSVNVPHFVPSSQQSEPMELSYKLDSNNFQEMPMELTKVFQRDPLELCVRQEFTQGQQPLMDLSSRVVSVTTVGGGLSMPLNGGTTTSTSSVSSSCSSASSQGHYSSSGINPVSVLSVPYHKSVDLIERELTLNDFTGAFRQPIDLISRTDDHSHELCSEGNLVDLSLRSSFGQDQSTSSFLRELIDLSSRSDSFHGHGEINLTNKPNSHPHPNPTPNQLHHSNTSNTNNTNSTSHPPTNAKLIASNHPQSHHSHSSHHNNTQRPYHHHHHPVQSQSHPGSMVPSSVSLQNVIYPDLSLI